MSDDMLKHQGSARIDRLILGGSIATAKGLELVALALEGRAKLHVAEGGQHQYGTPTPATPGRGPAVISGDLRRSITHTPIVPPKLETRVGPSSTPHTSYQGRSTSKRSRRRTGRGGQTTSGKIGLYLETGLRNGVTYPFMTQSFVEIQAGVPEIFRGTFRSL